MMEERIRKYPRTPHLQGSRLSPGDEDLSQIPFSSIIGKEITVEEKCDGANSGVSFSSNGDLLLQSRGHFLIGGAREKHFTLFKKWAEFHEDTLFDILEDRYVMYGEWMYAKHTVFYDELPHYFLEFDIYDKQKDVFLDTESRHRMLKDSPVVSVPVLCRKKFYKLEDLMSWIGKSNFISSNHMKVLEEYVRKNPRTGPLEDRITETDPSILMEGLYLKLEKDGKVKQRLKFVRKEFVQTMIKESTGHWLSRPIVPNVLKSSMEEVMYSN